MDKSYKTAFVDDFNAIAILLDDGQNPEAFKVRINERKAKKLREYFKKDKRFLKSSHAIHQ